MILTSPEPKDNSDNPVLTPDETFERKFEQREQEYQEMVGDDDQID